ncbi:hypothetical protein [Deinococcus sp. NW-56]|uniref:hypothetical protein n=1 Tax=Deinococcus sp. NW-56 TaxID=2080419 RepID=UPI000CF4FE1D|nr:hypothetical protein [Deinococcus sp. NW-56]
MSDRPVRPTPGVGIRIYDDFAEVRLRVESAEHRLAVAFPHDTWRQMVPHSLTLLDLPFTVMSSAPQPSWLASLEGRAVWLETSEGRQQVTLIRAEDLLVQDAEGAYLHAGERQLRFPEPPPVANRGEGALVNFELRAPGEGVLSYLTQALTWQAHYTLEVDGEGVARLTGQAELSNGTEQALIPESVTLMGGQVRLSGPRSGRRGARTGIVFASAPHFSPEFEDVREVAGLYTFELRNPPVLPARGSAVVPFQDIDLPSFQSIAGLFRSFDTRSPTQGTCSRHYLLRADQPLLAAQVTVRERGYLVGQAKWTETASGDPVNFSLGSDPDVTYTRHVQERVPPVEPERPSPSTRQVEYRVTYTFRNAKARPVLLRLGEHLGRGTVLALTGDAVLAEQNVTFETTLAAGEVREVGYEVVLEERE